MLVSGRVLGFWKNFWLWPEKKRKIHTNSMFLGGKVFWKKNFKSGSKPSTLSGENKKVEKTSANSVLVVFFLGTLKFTKKKKLANLGKKIWSKHWFCVKKSHQKLWKVTWPVQDINLPFLESDLFAEKFPSNDSRNHLVSLIHWLAPFFKLQKKNCGWHVKPQQKNIGLKKQANSYTNSVVLFFPIPVLP